MRAAFTLLIFLAACDAGMKSAPDETPVYRPGEAGTVDHALCLLGFAAVPLRRTAATGHHLVEVALNGRPGLFVLDTGANVSVVEDDHVAAFGLGGGRATRGPAIAHAGSVAARQVAVDDFVLGGLPIRQRRIAIADLGPLLDALSPLAGGTVHGLIGQDVLNEHRAVIDMDRPLLYLMEEDRSPAPIPAERCSSRGDDEPAAKEIRNSAGA